METYGTIAVLFFKKLFFVLLLVFIAAYLIYRLQTLLRRNVKIGWVERIENRSEISTILKTVISQKVYLKVRLNGRRRSFLSTLLSIQSSTLLIDALFPPEGNELITDTNFLRIDFTLRETAIEGSHIPYTFDVNYLNKEEMQNYPALRITFPQFIKRDQKRSYFRIDPPVNKPIYIHFFLDGQQTSAKIANISAGGVGFYTNQTKSVFWRNRKLKPVSIPLPGFPTIECAAIVHAHRQNDPPVLIDGNPVYYLCGVEFADLDTPQREIIIQYVIEKEREELRRLSREFG